jgi:hypothetical protein
MIDGEVVYLTKNTPTNAYLEVAEWAGGGGEKELKLALARERVAAAAISAVHEDSLRSVLVAPTVRLVAHHKEYYL